MTTEERLRIGEILVACGHTPADAIERALESQAVHGGRLGTCLIELGGVSLDAMADALARQYDMPAALERHFERSDPEVQELVPAVTAAKWRAVPLGRLPGDAAQVAVAVMDPLPKRAVAELEAAMSARVVTAIAPELRIRYQLERIYGVERPNRFKRTRAEGNPAAERRGFIRTLKDFDTVEPPSALARVSVKRIQVGPKAASMAAEVAPPPDVATMDGALRAIRRATGRVAVGELVVSALETGWGGALTAGMLMTIRSNLLFGWRGFARGIDPEVIESVAVPLDADTVFRLPCRSATSYFGPPRAPSDLDHRLWAVFGVGRPREIGIHPVTVFRKLGCVLYVQTAGEMPPEVAAGVAELGQSLCAALERLVKADQR